MTLPAPPPIPRASAPGLTALSLLWSCILLTAAPFAHEEENCSKQKSFEAEQQKREEHANQDDRLHLVLAQVESWHTSLEKALVELLEHGPSPRLLHSLTVVMLDATLEGNVVVKALFLHSLTRPKFERENKLCSGIITRRIWLVLFF